MSSLFFAILNDDNLCVAVVEYAQALEGVPSNYLSIDGPDDSLIGRTWNGSAWSEIAAVTDDEEAREWRNRQLMLTDSIVPLTDHPDHTATMAYRTALRGWPSTSDFPATRPTL